VLGAGLALVVVAPKMMFQRETIEATKRATHGIGLAAARTANAVVAMRASLKNIFG
jgi:hypothetical protein